MAAAPEQTLTQLCQWIEAEHGVRVSPTTLWKTLGRLGLTLKIYGHPHFCNTDQRWGLA
ncbi:winged helix-turn-helix domain-containing protein [Azotobacter sp. CWF10]